MALPTLRSSDVMNLLAEIEGTFPIHEWRVDGIPIWPQTRLKWFFAEWTAHFAGEPAQTESGSSHARYVQRILSGSIARARVRWQDRSREDRGPARRDVVFLSDGISFAKVGNAWVERFCDPLIAAARRLGSSSLMLTPLHRYHHPRLTPSRFVQGGVDRANLLGALRAKGRGGALELPAYAEVVRYIGDRGFGTAALATPTMAQDGSRIRAIADFYKPRLARIRPRIAFLVSYYSIEGMGFVLACRELGIPVVDIQHGVQGSLHPSYAGWGKPKGGRYALLPDYFWVWSDWEASAISAWSNGTGHTPIVGGNPWLDIWKPGSSWEGVNHALARARRLRDKAAGRVIVLVTLQYGLSASQQLEGLREALRRRDERFAWWVRLHPLMLDRRDEIGAALAGEPAVELGECTDLPLPAVLRFADVHVTHSSSTVIEAAQFGIRSVLTADFGAALFEPLIRAGWARVTMSDPDELLSTLAELAEARSRESIATPSPDTVMEALARESRGGNRKLA